MEPIENEEFLSRFDRNAEQGYILATEKRLIDKRLSDLAEDQKKIIQEKKDVAEQSGDNWHDGAFIATDNAASAVQSQAAAMFKARTSIVVQIPQSSELRVTIGSTVTIRQGGAQYKMMIIGMASLYRQDNDIEVCSILAPLAKALVGARAGESAVVTLNGQEQVVEIIDINQTQIRDFLSLDINKDVP